MPPMPAPLASSAVGDRAAVPVGAATTSAAPTSSAAPTDSAMGRLSTVRYSPATGSKNENAMGGISCTSALFTRTVTVNRLLLAASSTTPATAPSGTPKCAAGSASGLPSGGRLSPARAPSPRTVTVSSMGSPAATTVRLACTSMANPSPMAFTNVSGLPAWGSGRTTSRRRSPSARNAS